MAVPGQLLATPDLDAAHLRLFLRASGSSRVTRQSTQVCRRLSRMNLGSHLSCEALETLACDKKLSAKWRRRFEEAAWRLVG